jgi:hypothetical protein
LPRTLGAHNSSINPAPSPLPPTSYPYNLDFDFGALEGLTRYSINNLGDPFIESNYGVHSREFEVRRRLQHTLRPAA